MGLAEFFATADALVVLPPSRNPTSPTRRVRRLTSGSINGHSEKLEFIRGTRGATATDPNDIYGFRKLGRQRNRDGAYPEGGVVACGLW